MNTFALRRAVIAGGLPAGSAPRVAVAAGADSPALAMEVTRAGLAPLWAASRGGGAFARAAVQAALLYEAQRSALTEIDACLSDADIASVVIKGVALREWLYASDPARRVAGDIDLLVHPRDRLRAAQRLREAGFTLAVRPDTLSHEVTLTRGALVVDLHWDLLRPGRLRQWAASDVLDGRQRQHGMWVPSRDAQGLLLLVLPAVTRYLAWPAVALRLVDVLRWAAHPETEWAGVRPLLVQNGVAAAAWATLTLAGQYADGALAQQCFAWAASLPVPGLQKRWLGAWLQRAPLLRLRDGDREAEGRARHVLRRGGFSLWLSDTPADALRSITGWQRGATGAAYVAEWNAIADEGRRHD